jgi:hypothetical protein
LGLFLREHSAGTRAINRVFLRAGIWAIIRGSIATYAVSQKWIGIQHTILQMTVDTFRVSCYLFAWYHDHPTRPVWCLTWLLQ